MTFELTRREFLWLTASAGATVLAAPFTWQVLEFEERRTVLGVARTLFQHDGVPGGIYLEVVAAVDQRCRNDRWARHAVVEGIAELERACGEPFTNASESRRVELLEERKGDRFFSIVYSEALEALYGSPATWMALAQR